MWERQQQEYERRKREQERWQAQAQTSSRSQQENNEAASLTDEQNKRLLQVAGCAFLVAALVKVMASAVFGLSILLIPFLIYASQTVPSNESFDAKRELKRVLRGFHLAEDDPNKPKGWLQETVARVQASVTTEVSTSFGYELDLINIMNFATLACTRVPAAKVDCYWIGAFGKWHYVTMRSIAEREKVE